MMKNDKKGISSRAKLLLYCLLWYEEIAKKLMKTTYYLAKINKTKCKLH